MNDNIQITLATDESNWVAYRGRMTLAFKSRQWGNHLTSATIPPTYIAVGSVNGLTPDQRWEAEEATAMDVIASSVPDHIFNRIKNKTNVMEVWATMKSICQSRSETAITCLYNQLQGIKLEVEEDARAHLTKLSDLREKLASIGKIIDDVEFAYIILTSLPPPYQAAISIINAVDQAGISVSSDWVVRLVTDEYDRHIRKVKKNGSAKVFAPNGQKRDKRNVECYNCHNLGHYKADCWAKGGDREGQRPPRRNYRGRNNRGRNDRTDKGNNRGRYNNRSTNCRNDNCNDNITTANSVDIEAWAAIEEVEDNTPTSFSTPPPTSTPWATSHRSPCRG